MLSKRSLARLASACASIEAALAPLTSADSLLCSDFKEPTSADS